MGDKHDMKHFNLFTYLIQQLQPLPGKVVRKVREAAESSSHLAALHSATSSLKTSLMRQRQTRSCGWTRIFNDVKCKKKKVLEDIYIISEVLEDNSVQCKPEVVGDIHIISKYSVLEAIHIRSHHCKSVVLRVIIINIISPLIKTVSYSVKESFGY